MMTSDNESDNDTSDEQIYKKVVNKFFIIVKS